MSENDCHSEDLNAAQGRWRRRFFPDFFTYATGLISAWMETLADGDSESFEGEPDRHKVLCPLDQGNIVGSELEPDLQINHLGKRIETRRESPYFNQGSILHKPVLDLDLPIWVRQSTTPDHWHLIIDKEMPWRDYRKLLIVMKEVGILEDGFVNAALARKGSWIRTPWTRKENNEESQEELFQ